VLARLLGYFQPREGKHAIWEFHVCNLSMAVFGCVLDDFEKIFNSGLWLYLVVVDFVKNNDVNSKYFDGLYFAMEI
jgi:hypothetical protein